MYYQILALLIIVVYDFVQSIIQQVLINTNSSNICLPLSSFPLKFFIFYFPFSRFNHFSQILVLDFLNRLEFKKLFLWTVLRCHWRTVDHILHLEILLLPSLILQSCFHVLWVHLLHSQSMLLLGSSFSPLLKGDYSSRIYPQYSAFLSLHLSLSSYILNPFLRLITYPRFQTYFSISLINIFNFLFLGYFGITKNHTCLTNFLNALPCARNYTRHEKHIDG